jgi:hypothetical protein
MRQPALSHYHNSHIVSDPLIIRPHDRTQVLPNRPRPTPTNQPINRPPRCTACYRKGRTGEAFMKIAKAGEIHNFCHPNSLLTLQVGGCLCVGGGG